VTEASKLYLTIGLDDGYITLDVGNHAAQSYGRAKFRPFQCQDAAQWLLRFDAIDWHRVTLRSSCEHPDENELGDHFDVSDWIHHVAARMRSSKRSPRGPMSDERRTGKNVVVMCVECKTRYTTSKGDFDNRRNACPECDAWKACCLKDAEE
jgi:hypothetical protein